MDIIKRLQQLSCVRLFNYISNKSKKDGLKNRIFFKSVAIVTAPFTFIPSLFVDMCYLVKRLSTRKIEVLDSHISNTMLDEKKSFESNKEVKLQVKKIVPSDVKSNGNNVCDSQVISLGHESHSQEDQNIALEANIIESRYQCNDVAEVANGARGKKSSEGESERKFRERLKQLCIETEYEIKNFKPDYGADQDLKRILNEINESKKKEYKNLIELAAKESYPVKKAKNDGVTIMVGGGIQALNNNCSIASSLMALSNNGGLTSYIKQIENLVSHEKIVKLLEKEKLHSWNKNERKILDSYHRLLKLNEVLPELNSRNIEAIRLNDKLDNIRDIYKLRHGTMLSPIDDFLNHMINDLTDVQDFVGVKKRIKITQLRSELSEDIKKNNTEYLYSETLGFHKDSKESDHPEILILSINKKSTEFDKEVGISKSIKTSDGITKYKLTATLNFSSAHFVTFIVNEKDRRFYFANSMGLSMGYDDKKPYMIPTISTIPFDQPDQALESALSMSVNDNTEELVLRDIKKYWDKFSSTCYFAIYMKEENI